MLLVRQNDEVLVMGHKKKIAEFRGWGLKDRNLCFDMYANDFVNVETSPKKIVHDTIEVDLIFGYTTDTSPELGQGRAGCLQCLGESRRIPNQHQFVTHVGSHHWTCRSDQQIRGRRLLHVAQARLRVLTPYQPKVARTRPAGAMLDQR